MMSTNVSKRCAASIASGAASPIIHDLPQPLPLDRVGRAGNVGVTTVRVLAHEITAKRHRSGDRAAVNVQLVDALEPDSRT